MTAGQWIVIGGALGIAALVVVLAVCDVRDRTPEEVQQRPDALDRLWAWWMAHRVNAAHERQVADTVGPGADDQWTLLLDELGPMRTDDEGIDVDA